MRHTRKTEHLIKGYEPVAGLKPELTDLLNAFPAIITDIKVSEARGNSHPGGKPRIVYAGHTNQGLRAEGHGRQGKVYHILEIYVSSNGDYSSDEKRFLKENGLQPNSDMPDEARSELRDRRACQIMGYMINKYLG